MSGPSPLITCFLRCTEQRKPMNANPQFLAATATVDEAAIQPLPNSRKI
jgi:hypothetical protein